MASACALGLGRACRHARASPGRAPEHEQVWGRRGGVYRVQARPLPAGHPASHPRPGCTTLCARDDEDGMDGIEMDVVVWSCQGPVHITVQPFCSQPYARARTRRDCFCPFCPARCSHYSHRHVRLTSALLPPLASVLVAAAGASSPGACPGPPTVWGSNGTQYRSVRRTRGAAGLGTCCSAVQQLRDAGESKQDGRHGGLDSAEARDCHLRLDASSPALCAGSACFGMLLSCFLSSL